MPDADGRIRPISVPAVPWHEPDSPDERPDELERDDMLTGRPTRIYYPDDLDDFMHSVSNIRRKDRP